MKKQHLFILCGEAFSGKSTLAKKISKSYGAKIIGRDEIYFALDNMLAFENTPDEDDYALWKGLWPIAVQGIKNQLLLGNSVVVDDNCLYLHQRDELRAVAKDVGVEPVLIYLNFSTKTLKDRKERNKVTKERHDVPSGWLEEDSRIFERPTESESPIICTEEDVLDNILAKIFELTK